MKNWSVWAPRRCPRHGPSTGRGRWGWGEWRCWSASAPGAQEPSPASAGAPTSQPDFPLCHHFLTRPILYGWGYIPFFFSCHPLLFRQGKFWLYSVLVSAGWEEYPPKYRFDRENEVFNFLPVQKHIKHLAREINYPSSNMLWAQQFPPEPVGVLPTCSCFLPLCHPCLLMHSLGTHCILKCPSKTMPGKKNSLKVHEKVRSWTWLVQFYIYLQRGF